MISLINIRIRSSAIIGHFGLGFYSSFMVSDKVEVITKSYQEDAQAVKWTCDGSPEFSIEEVEKEKEEQMSYYILIRIQRSFLKRTGLNNFLKNIASFFRLK